MSDPHLHSHCFVYNAVFDREEERWKAGKFSGLKAAAPRFQKAFHNRFAWRLAELGYPIERRGDGWEVAGIGRDTIERFSARTRQIETFAAERGITDAREKDGIGARTRGRKRKDDTMPVLRELWDVRLTAKERAGMAVATAIRPFMATGSVYGSLGREEYDAVTSRNAISYADPASLPPGLAERQSPASRRRFLADHHDAMHRDPYLATPLPDPPSPPRPGHGR